MLLNYADAFIDEVISSYFLGLPSPFPCGIDCAFVMQQLFEYRDGWFLKKHQMLILVFRDELFF